MNKKRIGTQEIFEQMALSGSWEAYYHENSFRSYNFIARRDAVKDLVGNQPVERILDTGCGTGDYAPFLAQIGTLYCGFDFSFAMAKRAQTREYENPDIKYFLSADATALPFPTNSFDLVVAIGFIEYIEAADLFLEELKRVVKPGGSVIIQSYQKDFFWKLVEWVGIIKLRKLLGKVYRAIRGVPARRYDFNRPYTRMQLDNLLHKHGLDLEDYRYNNFVLYPRWLCALWPGLYIGTSERIDSHTERFERFAVNYVGKYKVSNQK